MKIKNLHLINFKRFTDLTIKDIPESAKLILLIGSNGSGKSSIFDALEVLNKYRLANFIASDDTYYNKNNKLFQIVADFGEGFTVDTNIKIHTGNLKTAVTLYYGRTSFRQVPRLTRTNIGGTSYDKMHDTDKPQSFIDRDERFENDLEIIFGDLLKDFFGSDEDKSKIKEQVIQPINAAFERIFNLENGTKLQLVELIPPLAGQIAQVNFKKGKSNFHYNIQYSYQSYCKKRQSK
jgi:AAA15 family ATPase/GTPase